MSNRNPEQTADLIIQALSLAKQRAILLAGWGGLQKTSVPDSIFMIDSIPHSWLFPRVSAVVHHGGASTTAAGLRAGVPSVVIPFFGVSEWQIQALDRNRFRERNLLPKDSQTQFKKWLQTKACVNALHN